MTPDQKVSDLTTRWWSPHVGHEDNWEDWMAEFRALRRHLEVPTAPMRLYRALRWAGQDVRAMSWTSDPRVAQRLASRARAGKVYTAFVQPSAVVAIIGGLQSEVIVDPARLPKRIVELAPVEVEAEIRSAHRAQVGRAGRKPTTTQEETRSARRAQVGALVRSEIEAQQERTARRQEFGALARSAAAARSARRRQGPTALAKALGTDRMSMARRARAARW